jgi:hypothetical protein
MMTSSCISGSRVDVTCICRMQASWSESSINDLIGSGRLFIFLISKDLQILGYSNMIIIDTLRKQAIKLLALRTHGILQPDSFHVQVFYSAQGFVGIPSESTQCDQRRSLH